MDTSKDYIEQCRKAAEIQKLQPDCVPIIRISGIPHKVFYGNSCNFWAEDTEKDVEWYVWLPRQDELQDMVDLTKYDTYVMGFSKNPGNIFMMWRSEPSPRTCNAKTMEQLWLAFVMKKKYNKQWNGTEWVEWEGA